MPRLREIEGAPDCSVDFGEVSPSGSVLWDATVDGEHFRALADGETVFLEWDDISYGITRERAVVDGAHRGDALRQLFGPPGTAVLAFHGVETLHGAAVGTPRGTVALLGEPGTGKTTLAWRLTRLEGNTLVADDLIALSEGSITPRVGNGELRLRSDIAVIEGLRSTPDGYGKYPAFAETDDVAPPLSLIIALEADESRVRPLSGAAAVEAIRKNFFNPVLTAPGQALRRFAIAADLAARVPVMRVPPRTLVSSDVMRLLGET